MKPINAFVVQFHVREATAKADADFLTRDSGERHRAVKTPDGWLVRNSETGTLYDMIGKVPVSVAHGLTVR